MNHDILNQPVGIVENYCTLAQRTLPLRCVICRAKILRLRQTQTCKLQPSYTFHSRSSSCSMSKKSSQLMSSSCSFKSNPWLSRFKYSKSLPGINGGSFKYRSSVNRSYSSTNGIFVFYIIMCFYMILTRNF